MTGIIENISHSMAKMCQSTTYMLWLPVVHIPEVLADHCYLYTELVLEVYYEINLRSVEGFWNTNKH
jgi:hypothetical protein